MGSMTGRMPLLGFVVWAASLSLVVVNGRSLHHQPLGFVRPSTSISTFTTITPLSRQPPTFATRGASSSSPTRHHMVFRRIFRGRRQDETLNETQVRELFNLWNFALQTGDAEIVASRYGKDPYFLPPVSGVPRTDAASIQAYYDTFLLKKPVCQILESKIRIGEDWAHDAGIYEFTLNGEGGPKVKARYSFIYQYEGRKRWWKIAHHHSSYLPGQIVTTKPISDVQVRNLLTLWNDALALDSDAVAQRYARNAVLLPTMSDKILTSNEEIKDYFDNLLLNKPQVEVLTSDVFTGANWAKDTGTYEYTMGATGMKVKARYTFVYIFEDGQWKISLHHSSEMPEDASKKSESISKENVRSLFNEWNEALATLDPAAVAARYATNAVMLATVSDLPRNTPELIKDYFEGFLLKKPRGTIIEGNIVTGIDFARDAGILQFNMDADGTKVRARYSFIYTLEDGEWKIIHHHSSLMPEAFLGPFIQQSTEESSSSSKPEEQVELQEELVTAVAEPTSDVMKEKEEQESKMAKDTTPMELKEETVAAVAELESKVMKNTDSVELKEEPAVPFEKTALGKLQTFVSDLLFPEEKVERESELKQASAARESEVVAELAETATLPQEPVIEVLGEPTKASLASEPEVTVPESKMAEGLVVTVAKPESKMEEVTSSAGLKKEPVVKPESEVVEETTLVELKDEPFTLVAEPEAKVVEETRSVELKDEPVVPIAGAESETKGEPALPSETAVGKLKAFFSKLLSPGERAKKTGEKKESETEVASAASEAEVEPKQASAESAGGTTGEVLEKVGEASMANEVKTEIAPNDTEDKIVETVNGEIAAAEPTAQETEEPKPTDDKDLQPREKAAPENTRSFYFASFKEARKRNANLKFQKRE